VRSVLSYLRGHLAEPRTRGLDLDDPRTTELRRVIIQDKPFLRRIYADWYSAIRTAVPPGRGCVLELGSGGGFLEQYLPGLITSDLLPTRNVQLVADGTRLPIRDGSLRAIVMTNVFHHLSEPGAFLAEAARCTRPAGALVMIEPWLSTWSRWVYTGLHHEACDPGAEDWTVRPGGVLSTANSALPWMVFERDLSRFARDFPSWRLCRIEKLMPVRYLVAGGVSLRALAPASSYALWAAAERLLRPWMSHLAMFALIVLERAADD
jgi:SAM-dependent methyltransferase